MEPFESLLMLRGFRFGVKVKRKKLLNLYEILEVGAVINTLADIFETVLCLFRKFLTFFNYKTLYFKNRALLEGLQLWLRNREIIKIVIFL